MKKRLGYWLWGVLLVSVLLVSVFFGLMLLELKRGNGQAAGGFLFIAMGGLLLYWWSRLRAFVRQTLSWPQVLGNVIESKLEEVRDADGVTYHAHVVYRYEINGVELRGTRLGPTGMQTAHDIVRKYPSGKAIPVFYDPAEPKSAVLERNGSTAAAVLLASIIVLAAGGVLIVAAG